MFAWIFRTRREIAPAIIRIILGVVFFAHGAQKMFGWFGGPGFTGAMEFFVRGMHVPPFFAFMAMAAEFFGGIGLILGFLARAAAFAIFVEMVVAVRLVHRPNGFFMNWTGTQKGEGFEYHLLVFAMAAAIMIAGSGAFSIDGAICRKDAS